MEEGAAKENAFEPDELEAMGLMRHRAEAWMLEAEPALTDVAQQYLQEDSTVWRYLKESFSGYPICPSGLISSS